jgi:serine/threonine protein kinase
LSLAAKIEERRSASSWFSSQEILDFMRPILHALQILSDAELVHRDVKPDNILFLNGMPCLGDIGLLCADSEDITRRGTDGYAAPKWYMDGGGHPDMYGAAVTLYVLLTGNRPDKMGRSAFRWPPHGKDSLSEDERTAWRDIHQVIASAISDQIQERFNNFQQFERTLSGNIRPPESRFAERSLSIPEATREEIKALQVELEAARLELQKLRGEFEAFVSATVTDLDHFKRLAPKHSEDANRLLADSANRFVTGLQTVPSKSQLEQKLKFAQRARDIIKTIRKEHGPALCAGLEELRNGLEKTLKSERNFRIKEIGKVIAKALSAYKVYARANPGAVRGLSGLLGISFIGMICPGIGAVPPHITPGIHSNTDPEGSFLKLIGSARRFVKAQ